MSDGDPIAPAKSVRTIQGMTTSMARAAFTARYRTTGEQLTWRDAIRDVWTGAASPEDLEIAVIWPDSLCEVID